MEDLMEFLAERQWLRMTRSGVPWGELSEHDRTACRALVTAVVTDLRAWEFGRAEQAAS